MSTFVDRLNEDDNDDEHDGFVRPPLVFKRRELLVTAPPMRHSLVVYSPSKKSRQRFGVGDSTGQFTVYSVGKSRACATVFEAHDAAPEKAKEEPDEGCGSTNNDTMPHAVSCATLYADQLFVMRNGVVDAYSRKGTHFFRADTRVTEAAHTLVIDTPFIFTAGTSVLTVMQESTEVGFYLAPDSIVDMAVLLLPKTCRTAPACLLSSAQQQQHRSSSRTDHADMDDEQATLANSEQDVRCLSDYLCCLACLDGVLRVVQSVRLCREIVCPAVMTALHVCSNDVSSVTRLYFGTESGEVGAYTLEAGDGAENATVDSLWMLRLCSSSSRSHHSHSSHSQNNTGNINSRNMCTEVTSACEMSDEETARMERVRGVSVSCLICYDIDGDGKEELIAGYEDGTVCVFGHRTCNHIAMMSGGCCTTANHFAKLSSGSLPEVASPTSTTHRHTCDEAARLHTAFELLVPLWRTRLQERVMSVAAGIVTATAQRRDILVHLYSGRVMSLTRSTRSTEVVAQQQEPLPSAALTTIKSNNTHSHSDKPGRLVDTYVSQHTTPLYAQGLPSGFHARVTLQPRAQSVLVRLVMESDVPLRCALVRSVVPMVCVAVGGQEERGSNVRAEDGEREPVTVVTMPHRCSANRYTNIYHTQGAAASSSAMMEDEDADVYDDDDGVGWGGTDVTRTHTLALILPSTAWCRNTSNTHNSNSNINTQDSSTAGGTGVAEKEACRRMEVGLWAAAGMPDTLTVTLYTDNGSDDTSHGITTRTEAGQAVSGSQPHAATDSAQVKTALLHALPLYRRVGSVWAAAAAAGSSRPAERSLPTESDGSMSRLTMYGEFRASDVHLWLTQLLPGTPAIYQPSLTQQTWYYTCEMWSTLIMVEQPPAPPHAEQQTHRYHNWQEGMTMVSFVSDSVSALWVIQRFIRRASAQRGQSAHTDVSIRYGSVARQLHRLHAMLRYYRTAAVRVGVGEALDELLSHTNVREGGDRGSAVKSELLSLVHMTRSEKEVSDPYVCRTIHASDAASGEDAVENDTVVALPVKEMVYVRQTVVALYESVIHFTAHAPPLTPERRAELWHLTSARYYDKAAVDYFFFPRQEHLQERARLSKIAGTGVV